MKISKLLLVVSIFAGAIDGSSYAADPSYAHMSRHETRAQLKKEIELREEETAARVHTEEEAAKLRSQLSDATRQIQILEQDLATRKKAFGELLKERDLWRGERERLLEDRYDCMKKKERQQQECARLRRERDEAKQTNRRLRRELDALRLELEQLRRALAGPDE